MRCNISSVVSYVFPCAFIHPWNWFSKTFSSYDDDVTTGVVNANRESTSFMVVEWRFRRYGCLMCVFVPMPNRILASSCRTFCCPELEKRRKQILEKEPGRPTTMCQRMSRARNRIRRSTAFVKYWCRIWHRNWSRIQHNWLMSSFFLLVFWRLLLFKIARYKVPSEYLEYQVLYYVYRPSPGTLHYLDYS